MKKTDIAQIIALSAVFGGLPPMRKLREISPEEQQQILQRGEELKSAAERKRERRRQRNLMRAKRPGGKDA